MAIFTYQAKDLQGQTHKGEIETAGEKEAAALLRRKRLIVISIKPKTEGEEKYFWQKYFSGVPFSQVVIVTRQLATMIGAGLVLSESLDILEEQQNNGKFKRVLKEVGSDVRNGIDFATALEKHPDVFPNLYCQLVRAGQASGKLDTILVQLATNLEKEREFRSKIKGAMIYPLVVLTMMVGVMLLMVFFVMPKLMGLYKESGLELPITTRIMLGLTDFMLNFWWAVAAILIVIGVLVKKYLVTTAGRLMFDNLVLKIPVISKIISLVVMTNFTRTLGLLTASGISILEAIKIISDITDNRVFKNYLELSYKGVERGLTFSSQLLAAPLFPKIVGQMVKTGEETGKLDDVMFKMADYFESEADNSLKNITTLIEPIILVILGIGVAVLVISVILPIYQLTTNIK